MTSRDFSSFNGNASENAHANAGSLPQRSLSCAWAYASPAASGPLRFGFQHGAPTCLLFASIRAPRALARLVELDKNVAQWFALLCRYSGRKTVAKQAHNGFRSGVDVE